MHIRRTYPYLLAATTTLGCAASSPVPPQEDPYFPAGLAMSPEERHLFVLSANSDLQYGAGTLIAFDLEAVAQMAVTWNGGEGSPPAGCTPDPTRRQLAVCPTGPNVAYVVPSAVQVGNFGVGVGVMTMDDERLRLFSAVRGDPSVTWVDFDPATGRFDCTGERDFDAGKDGRFPRCDDRHRLNAFHDDEDLGKLKGEPFGISVDGTGEHALVTHLGSGRVDLVSAPRDPARSPRLEDELNEIWQGNGSNLLGAVGVAPRLPGDEDTLFYVTSNQENRVNMVRVVDQPAADGTINGRLVRAGYFFNSPGPHSDGSIGGDARGIAFSPDGNRLFMVGRPTRVTGQILAFDTSLDEQGVPKNQQIGQVEICSAPSEIGLYDPGDGLRLYVPCFGNGQVWVVNVEGMNVEATIDVGIGPSSIAIAQSRRQAYVGNYGEDTVTVVDLDRTSPTYHYGVLRLGKKR